MRLLAAFIGTGNYMRGRYHWAGARDILPPDAPDSHETQFVQAALARMLEPDRCIVFVTPEAESRHWQGLLDAFAQAELPPPEKIPIHKGENAEEIRSNFGTIIRTLNDSVPSGDGSGRDDRIFIDITHSFRSLPFFVGAAVSLLNAVRADWPETRIVYGAWEAGTKTEEGLHEAPIWDLTYFVDMVDWAQALRLFLKTGRAEDAARIGEQAGNRLSAEWARAGRRGKRPKLKDFARALREFSSHFATVRTGQLLLGHKESPSLADKLLTCTREIRDYAGEHLPGLDLVLGDLIDMIKPLAGSPRDLAGPANADRVAALAELYRRFDRPLQAVMTLREGYVNLVAPPAAARPGASSFDRRAREQAEAIARSLFPRFHHEASELRNDLMHAGYRENAVHPRRVMETLERVMDGFREDSRLRGPFLNISNHPSTDWSDDQRRAALALGQPIRDMRFPEVPPDADETWIVRKAEELAQAARALSPSAALVQGEFTLTFALVERLEAAGVPCYAASTPRLVEPADETTEREGRGKGRMTRREFRFTRLRRYKPQSVTSSRTGSH